ncbi:hypothetical protein DBV14_12935 [Variovorax sp. KBW07]|uniref:hypothetical protein n=1 Tax=Variovorax sp. KBW07 TaxID=2153358 RepID=UPI000F58CB33|nr:hypothetical protein [Variovorax sp. KBW07]RQO54547.1 hypothetical protein DBV14_12935 [Variovorax sp. KBW07]
MSEPRGRRHPLFLQLTKLIDRVYPDAVTPVARSDDEPLDDVEPELPRLQVPQIILDGRW